MVINSYAKINLSLIVKKRLNNKLHDLQSIYCLIDLKDKISIKKIKKKNDLISFTGPHSKYISKYNNSIKKVLVFLRKNNIITDYYSIKIYKNIPVFAGFGGGTSNAAAILKFLIKKNISQNLLNKITKIIGSDLGLFFHNQGYLKNLKSISKLKKNYKLNFLIVYPNIKSSTKEVFSRVKKFSKKKLIYKNNLKSKSEFIEYLLKSKNDLQDIVTKNYPFIKKLLKIINETKGCYFSRMTGSGSACYGLFTSMNSSKVALKKLRKKYPKFWFSIAKTI